MNLHLEIEVSGFYLRPFVAGLHGRRDSIGPAYGILSGRRTFMATTLV
jgi:hypothetical protein